VVHRDSGVVHTAGYGEYAPDRIYLVMSSSKIVSVGVLMRLADEGLLDLDAPIGDIVPSWSEGKAALTVAELVSCSSGLPALVDYLLYAPYSCQFVDTGTLADCASMIYTTVEDAADRIPPDTEFRYGGAQWQLAGGVAEIAGGKSWSELFAETYAPCGISDSGYTNATSLISFTFGPEGGLEFSGVGYPETLNGNPDLLPVTSNPSIEGGMYTTVEDYGKLLLMHLRGGMCGETRVLSEAAVERMRMDRILSYGGSTEEQMRLILRGADPDALDYALNASGYGLGWWVDRAHPGVVFDPGAFGSQVWLDVPRGYGVLIAIEGNVVLGAELAHVAKPLADAVFDSAE
jgi:CubicO group peptidase (beta-lactamase class C family)